MPTATRPTDPRVRGKHAASIEAQARKARVIELTRLGHTLDAALADVGVSYSAYKKWRERDRHFAAAMDIARIGELADPQIDLSLAQFVAHHFGMPPAPFQAVFMEEMENTALGTITLALWPPDHGKTSTFENYATAKIAAQPNWRGVVASENGTIAKKILGRIKNRLEPDGPYPRFVEQYGPFKPPTGQGNDKRVAQPWGAAMFNVYKKAIHDERDYTLMALGYKSSIVSTRCDHLHVDDLQSTKTLNLTNAMEEWFRQDALSRPGEHGKTTIAGTRVGDDDIYERLLNDEGLSDIIKVIKFRAIITDPLTGEQTPLWPERYDLDQLDRMRKKVGQEAWDRNYMQAPGLSNTSRTFTDEMIEHCKDADYSLTHPCSDNAIVYVGLDPALGGQNCVIACEVAPNNRLIIRAIREVSDLQRNEQIMDELAQVVARCQMTANVTDVVIETKNFQAGLARDERLLDMQHFYGFAMREHLTGWNKYDESVGVASMCSSFQRGEIVLPWAADDLTRNEIGELIRQLKAWKPGKRGNKLRQDRVMALWFVWILWRQRHKEAVATEDSTAWRRKGVPWGRTQAGLVLPPGVRM